MERFMIFKKRYKTIKIEENNTYNTRVMYLTMVNRCILPNAKLFRLLHFPAIAA